MSNPTLQANFSAGTAGFTQGMSVLKQKLLELNTNMEQTKQAIKNANSEVRQYQKQLEQLRKATNNGSTATDEQKKKMQELRDRIAQTTSQLGVLRTTEQDLRGQIRNATSEIQKQQATMGDVKSAAATMGDVLKANLWSSAIQTAVSKLLSSLKQAAQYCYNVGSSFEAGMSQVEAISGASADELDRLTAKAKELGASTKFTASETASAMNYMAMAGWDAQQMLDGIDGVLSLAAASGGDLAQTSDIVTDAITAFGLAAEDVGHFSDVLAAASANANTNVAMMGETFQYCAPVAGALGFSIEDVSEAIGLMANSGIKSSMAGTALRTLFTNLSSEVKITGKDLGEVTIQTSNADGSMRSLRDILTDMRGAFSQLSEAERSSQAESIAGKYAMSGFLALMNAGEGDVQKLRGAIEGCGGASEEMAQTMQDNVSGAVTVLKSAVEGLGIAAYDKFGDKLKDTVNGVTDVISDLTEKIDGGEFDAKFDRMADSVGKAAEELVEFTADALPDAVGGLANLTSFVVENHEAIAALIKAYIAYKAAMGFSDVVSATIKLIGSVTTALKKQRTATEAATTAQQANNAAMSAAPWGLVAAGVAAVVGVLELYNSSLDDCNERMRDYNDIAEECRKKSEEYAESADELEDFKKRYDDIKNSAAGAYEETNQLRNWQRELINQYPELADAVDLTAQSYDNLIQKLSETIDKYRDLSDEQAEAAITSAREAEKQGVSINLGSNANTFWNAGVIRDWAMQNLDHVNPDVYTSQVMGELVSGAYGAYADKSIQLYGGYDDMAADLEKLYKYLMQRGDTDLAADVKSQLDYVKGQAEMLAALEGRLSEPEEQTTAGHLTGSSATAAEYARHGKQVEKLNEQKRESSAGSGSGDDGDGDLEEKYDSDQKYLKWRLDMGYITEAEYYAQLADLRDKYLDESSDKWRSATLAIHKYQISQNGNALNEIKQQYSAAVSAIDDEIKQHDRDREDEDINSRIADVERQLQYGRLDEYSRMQLEDKRRELLDEKTETEWKRQKSDEKEMLNTVYTMAKEAYDKGTADLNSALQTASAVFSAIGTGAQQTASTVSTVNNNSVSMIMNAVSQTSDRIAAAVIKALSSAI